MDPLASNARVTPHRAADVPLKILNAEPENYSPAARRILESFAEVDERVVSPAELQSRIAGYDVLIVRFGHRVDRALLEAARKLRFVVTAATGLDHVDLDAAKAHNVEVLSLQGEHDFLDSIKATAEHTWALVLALARRIPAATASVVNGRWNRDAFIGLELRGRTMGIVGYGRLGRMVGRFAAAFEMHVCACDPAPRSGGDDVRCLPFEALLQESDVVSLHLPLTDATRGLIGPRQFERMKRGAWLINTSRGGIVDESGLLAALEAGRLGGAALDVLANEDSRSAAWLEGHPLVAYASRHDNLLLTPHLGGATREAMAATEEFMARKLQARVAALGL
jgi:D-3-phosphoglycerate dehydrogenase